MFKKNAHLQRAYLEEICNEAIPVSIYLINGIKLSGFIYSFDQFVVVLKDNKSHINQLIYKHAISTIVPTKPFAKDLSALRDSGSVEED